MSSSGLQLVIDIFRRQRKETFEVKNKAADAFVAEIDFDSVDSIKGMNITFVTTAPSNEEAKELLVHLGMPFRS